MNVLVLADRLEVGLPACRALARNGHVVGAATSTRSSPVLASRAIDHGHIFPDRSASQEVWRSALHAAVSEFAYDVVLACHDVDVVRLLDHRKGIPSVPSISPLQEVILDKAALASLCSHVDVAYPRTFAPSSRSDYADIAATVVGEAVVKPARPAVATNVGVVHMAGSTLVSSRRSMMSAVERYLAAGLWPIIQERVDGSKVQAAIIRRSGVTSCQLVALVELGTPAEATLRQLDSTAGLGADCVAALERLADRASYEGILQAEFLAPVSGKPVLIDVNPRLWGGLSFAELVGLEMTECAAADALGRPTPVIPVELLGRRYHHVAREIAYVIASPRRLPSVVSQWSSGDVWDAPPLTDLRPHLVQGWQQMRTWRRRRLARKSATRSTG